MNSIHYLNRSDDIAIVGWALRLPGAKSPSDLWSLLIERRCSVSSVPADRFSRERFGHPRLREPGKSYSWAAGILDDIWGFDPGVFGISPREAEQMDPQQRILLQLTWEALEDAGIRPSSIAGADIGVFVGASQTDYAHGFFADYARADSHFATGTALAILANRISHIYDLHGPSITIDTACSSSLVALHHAVEALRAGRIDTAIVGGINVIASPASFIAFSQASMLSPTGLCHAFSADADGFVRAEGGAVLVLRRASAAQADHNPIHGIVLATGVNSDGRTNGISLPSLPAQEALLKGVYARFAIDPDRLAFVEAHGTGTAAGDPIEANALGRCIGQSRSEVLPIGSIKTNIGHLEPASGLAGLLKACMALNEGILPPSLHFAKPNPNIDFDRLNLKVCGEALPLPNAAQQYAGVSSFGFGGTNAHAVIAAGKKARPPAAASAPAGSGQFAFSAAGKDALAALARRYRDQIASITDQETLALARAIAHRRDHLSHRVAIASTRKGDVRDALTAFLAGEARDLLTTGTALDGAMPVAFVYSGNGSQWVGMGRSAYRNNAQFRGRFDQVDRLFANLAGWSLTEALFADTLEARLPLTSVAQPLIFAIQSAATAALRARGLSPAVVLGHSVGEVAAAEAAGILSLRAAVEVIHSRSTRQELVCGGGRMAAVLAPEETIRKFAEEVGGIEIAAVNSPRALTIAGAEPALENFKSLAAMHGIAVLDLDLTYPFHTALMDPVRESLLTDLRHLKPTEGAIPFISTITGERSDGTRLDAGYWWKNVREPVQFVAAVRAAARLGARYFIEIGPRKTLLKHINDTLAGEANACVSVSALDRTDVQGDPFERTISVSLVNGAALDIKSAFGEDPGPSLVLPTYPWQQQPFRIESTSEAIGSSAGDHPLAGARPIENALTWYSSIDIAKHSYLTDHKLGEQVIFPGTGFLEIILSVARQWLRCESVTVADLEILKPLDLTNGEAKEVMTRISAGSNTVEVLSRPRLSQIAWLLHCRAKLIHGTPESMARSAVWSSEGVRVDSTTIYDIAQASGLCYGPAFRLLDEVIIEEGNLRSCGRRLSVRLLAPETSPGQFVLDPMRLDACTHGVFAAFPELRAEERGVAYIPVHLEEAHLYRPGISPARTSIEILSRSERAIVANYFIFDEAGDLIAVLRGVRCQAVPVRRSESLETVALAQRAALIDGRITGQTGVHATTQDILAASGPILCSESEESVCEEPALLDAWAAAAAYEIASGLGEDGVLDLDLLIAKGRLAHEMRPWFGRILSHLEAAGLTRQDSGLWLLVPDLSLPDSSELVKALASECPARAVDLLLAGAVSGLARQVMLDRALARPPESILTNTILDFYDGAARGVQDASSTIARLMLETNVLRRRDRAVRVLQIGFGPLTDSILALKSDNSVQLSVFEPDPRRYERAALGMADGNAFTLLSLDDHSNLGTYDLIVSACGLHRLPPSCRLGQLRQLLEPCGLLLAIEQRPSLFNDLVFGLDAKWFANGSIEHPIGSLWPREQWRLELERAGFDDVRSHLVRCGSDRMSLLVAETSGQQRSLRADEAACPVKKISVVAPSCQGEFVHELAKLADVTSPVLADSADIPSPAPDHLVFVAPSSASHSAPAEAIAGRCLQIKGVIEQIGGAQATLWLLFFGAIDSGSTTADPVETAVWAFSRTLANEFPKIDIRRIDVAPGVSAAVAAGAVAQIIRSGTDETEIQVDGAGLRAVRIEPLSRILRACGGKAAEAVRLERSHALRQRLTWKPSTRRRPDVADVEIAVEATGLNFRDLMWTLSMLPDDMLEDGFSGPTLGLECAGRVVRAGRSVKHLKPGDRVVTLAASAFSTHVTVPGSYAAKMPSHLSYEDAATIPVAFLTAYYSLITLADLKRDEWALIHGGAGGLGMAAIQIAESVGAKIIATAGSPAKRDLLRALGVHHVLNSRSTGFVEDVRRITGNGVDVVLNSLAGEAMERSIACLRPFGRFLELGKRDYVTNTHVGLRPFRKNLSYFGIDLAQLISNRPDVGARIYEEVMARFADGRFKPLPHSVFEADNIAEAFHLMQHSSHVGKIVVRRPREGSVRAANKPLTIDANGTHIVTGAFGGFGMETVKWLAERGARHMVLIGRSGAGTLDAKNLLRNLADRGIKVLADRCDVTDLRALERLFEKIGTTMPPVAGVIHAAMVLDDAIVKNLDQDRFHRVLAPKVTGAENLDLVTRGQPLDYFVLFSSVTTMIGNPGQGNYVAANAYLEGLARRRRREGLPALAIGWGPITDVGAVARSDKLLGNLKKLTGVNGMRAREALDLMVQAMEQPGDVPDLAVLTISPNDGSFRAGRLPVLRSPTYRYFVDAARGQSEEEAVGVDLRALVKNESPDVARRKVAGAVVTQVAHVLRCREEDVSLVRPLGEIGLDSLMALELVMNLEKCFGIDITLGGSAALSVLGVADEIIAHVTAPTSRPDPVMASLAEQHLQEVRPEQLVSATHTLEDDAVRRRVN